MFPLPMPLGPPRNGGITRGGSLILAASDPLGGGVESAFGNGSVAGRADSRSGGGGGWLSISDGGLRQSEGASRVADRTAGSMTWPGLGELARDGLGDPALDTPRETPPDRPPPLFEGKPGEAGLDPVKERAGEPGLGPPNPGEAGRLLENSMTLKDGDPGAGELGLETPSATPPDVGRGEFDREPGKPGDCARGLRPDAEETESLRTRLRGSGEFGREKLRPARFIDPEPESFSAIGCSDAMRLIPAAVPLM